MCKSRSLHTSTQKTEGGQKQWQMHLESQAGLPSARYVPSGNLLQEEVAESLSPNLKKKHLQKGRRESQAQEQQEGHQTSSSMDPRQHHVQLLTTDG